MNYWNKDKKPTGLNPQKKRTNWNQSLRSSGTKSNKPKKINQLELNKSIEEYIDAKDSKKSAYSAMDKIHISQYTGSGALIKQGASGKGILYEYYTPDKVIERMWGLA